DTCGVSLHRRQPVSVPAIPRIQTVYEPGSFTPLIRVETENGEREKAQRRSLAETLQQEGSENGHGVVFPAPPVWPVAPPSARTAQA
ncbi:hypothetical protein ACUODJ_56160, partial [Escherichia sp. HC-CC]